MNTLLPAEKCANKIYLYVFLVPRWLVIKIISHRSCQTYIHIIAYSQIHCDIYIDRPCVCFRICKNHFSVRISNNNCRLSRTINVWQKKKKNAEKERRKNQGKNFILIEWILNNIFDVLTCSMNFVYHLFVLILCDGGVGRKYSWPGPAIVRCIWSVLGYSSFIILLFLSFGLLGNHPDRFWTGQWKPTNRPMSVMEI